MANTNAAGAKQASDGGPDGLLLGQSATDKVAFFGGTPAVKPTVSGSAGSNAALESLLTALEGLGLIVDSST